MSSQNTSDDKENAIRVLLVTDGIPSVAKHIAEQLKNAGMHVCGDPVIGEIPREQTFDRRDVFIKRTDKRFNHNPEAYLNINRRKNKRRF